MEKENKGAKEKRRTERRKDFFAYFVHYIIQYQIIPL
jgi:hypothetical protein